MGIWRQSRYGNARLRASLLIGAASIAGVEVGVQIATSLSEEVLRRLFGLFLLCVAVQLGWRAVRAR
jgi:uncharacterized membrane protein YfcA